MFEKSRAKRKFMDYAEEKNKDIAPLGGMYIFQHIKGEGDLHVVRIEAGMKTCPVLVNAQSYDEAKDIVRQRMNKGGKGFFIGCMKP